MKIKKSQLTLAVAALVAVSTIGISSATLAAGRNHSKSTTNTATSTATSTNTHLERGPKHTLTDAEKTAMAAKKAEMDAKKTAEEAALKANDSNAWVTAVGANAPILQKITATNFSTYVELYNLHQQEQTLATQLGLTGNDGRGLGMGFGTSEHGQAN